MALLALLADPANRTYEAIEKFFGCRTTLSEFLSDSVEIKAIPIFIPEIRQGIEDVRYHNAVSRLSYLPGYMPLKPNTPRKG